MAIKDTDRKARANYKKKVTTVRVELYGTDEDIREHVENLKESGESVQGYIKALIRADIAGVGYRKILQEEIRKVIQENNPVREEERKKLLDLFDSGVNPADVFKFTREK